MVDVVNTVATLLPRWRGGRCSSSQVGFGVFADRIDTNHDTYCEDAAST
jgi:hypothetical protein